MTEEDHLRRLLDDHYRQFKRDIEPIVNRLAAIEAAKPRHLLVCHPQQGECDGRNLGLRE